MVKIKIIVFMVLIQCLVIVGFGSQPVKRKKLLNDSYEEQEISVEYNHRYFYSSLNLKVKSDLYHENFDLDVTTYQDLNCDSNWIDDSHMYLSIISGNDIINEYVLDFSGFYKRAKLLDYADYQQTLLQESNDDNQVVEDSTDDFNHDNLEVKIDTETSTQPKIYFAHTITSYQDIQEVQYEIPSKDSNRDFYDERTYRYSTGATMDIQIIEGKVQVTKNQGATWVDVPVNGGRLVDYWLSYLRIGEQSYYYQNDVIIIAYQNQYYMPHLIISNNDGKTWNDICFDMADKNGFRECQITYEENNYILSLDNEKICYSNDAINWYFY